MTIALEETLDGVALTPSPFGTHRGQWIDIGAEAPLPLDADEVEAFEAAIEDVAATAAALLQSLGVDVEAGPDRWTAGKPRAHSHPPAPTA